MVKRKAKRSDEADRIQDAIYEMVSTRIQERTFAHVDKLWTRDLVDDLIEAVFAQTLETGRCRLPRGLGVLAVDFRPSIKRKNLQGEWYDTGPIAKVRYREGATVLRALGRPDKYAPKRAGAPRKIRRMQEIVEGKEPR